MSRPVTVAAFDALGEAEARALVRPCLDVERWVAAVVGGRPYGSRDDLLAAARTAADPLTPAEVDAALAHHPRIGERAPGSSAEADLSRAEQRALGIDADVAAQLEAGNRAYEERFGRVFLIRAAGRSAGEILEQLRTRLGNDTQTEDDVVGEQLRQIALVRLEGLVRPEEGVLP